MAKAKKVLLDNNNMEMLSKLSKIIEDLVWEHDISYLDAIVLYAEKTETEIDQIAEYIKMSEPLIQELRKEAIKLKMIEDDSVSSISLDEFFNRT